MGKSRIGSFAALVLLSASFDRHSPLQFAAASGRAILPVSAGATHLRASLRPSHRFVGNVGLSGLRLRGGEGEVGNNDGSIQLPMLRSMLDMSTALTNASTTEGAGPSPREPLDMDRIKWLNAAFKEMVENTTDVFRDSIKDLSLPDAENATGYTPENLAKKETALANIAERVAEMDLAVALRNLGGFPGVVGCLSSEHQSLRWSAADVLGIALVGNEELQALTMELGALPLLANMYANRFVEESMTRQKALGAVSALVRGNRTNELAFLHNQGLATLRADILIAEPRMRAKALFAFGQLLQSNAPLRAAVLLIEQDETGVGKGMIPELVSCLAFPDPQVVEFAISALLFALRDATEVCLASLRTQVKATELAPLLETRLAALQAQGAADTDQDMAETGELLHLFAWGFKALAADVSAEVGESEGAPPTGPTGTWGGIKGVTAPGDCFGGSRAPPIGLIKPKPKP